MGSNTAVGMASRKDSIMGKLNSVFAYLKNPAKPFFLIAPTAKSYGQQITSIWQLGLETGSRDPCSLKTQNVMERY